MKAADRISLLFFEGCPHADAARNGLRDALRLLGLPEQWEELDLASPQCPEHLHGFPSPTILIDGADLFSGKRAWFGPLCCNASQVPSGDELATLLRPKLET